MISAGFVSSSSHWIDALGYAAACFTIATYSMKTMIPLRAVSLIASMLFIAYGYLVPSYPQLLLHGVLLPLNAIRLRQMINLVEDVRMSANGDLSMEWLSPYSARRRCREGEILFRKGDAADAMFYTVNGRYRLTELGIDIEPGQLIGEIGMVAPENRRTQTCRCTQAGELLSIDYDRVKELYYQNPRFGFYFLNLVTKRLIANTERLEKRLALSEQTPRRKRKSRMDTAAE